MGRRALLPPELPGRRAVLVAAALVLAGALVAVPPGPTPAPIAHAWYGVRIAAQLLGAVVIVARVRARREDRAPWAIVAAGVLFWTLGDLSHVTVEPLIAPWLPLSVLGWLGCYASVYAGLVLLIRRLLLRGQTAVWLDGAILGLALAAIAGAVLVDEFPHHSGRHLADLAVNLAYPVADLVLVAMAMGAWSVAGWHPPPAWRWLLAAVVVMLAGDSAYFVAWGGGYVYGDGASFEAAWALAFLAMAAAAWAPDPLERLGTPRLWGSTALPAAVTVVATALLAFDRDGVVAGRALSVAALLAVSLRSVLSVRELRALALTRQEALTDELTGLANRRALLRRAGSACGAGSAPAALLLCDLDGFKEFNDTLGHEAGDELLREAAARIDRALAGRALVGRLGGDEFAVLAEDAGREAALALAAQVRAALDDPLPVADIAVRLDASVGIALSPDHCTDPAGLLRRADVAMYEAKLGRSGVGLYDPARDLHTRERLLLAGELRDAVDAGELEVHFQPKVEVATGRVLGAEALVRWRHPERGLLMPDAFLPSAEQAGLMRPLALVVLDQALGACGRWTAAGHDAGVAVNLSASNLLDASLPDEVAARLAAHGVAPEQLTLEVTEGTILDNPLRSGEVLAAVRRLGVAVSLDDFGTGHSSLSHVKRLPVDELKLDRSFVSGLRADGTDRAIVEATVRLAHTLGMVATAEGVEDDGVLALLREMGCDLAQGYLFSRPLPEAQLLEWLAAREAVLRPRRRRASSAGCRPASGS